MKKQSIKTLKAKLDKVMSEYIRLSHADSMGNCKCYTCGKELHWKQIHNGHFISRGKLATRFDMRNQKPQCCGCNTFKNGEPQKYWLKLEKEIGREELEDLIQTSNQIIKLHPDWYKEKIKEISELVKHLKEEKNF